MGLDPVMPQIRSAVCVICLQASSMERDFKLTCSYPWHPIRCPSFSICSVSLGYCSACFPSTKKVALTSRALSPSRSSCVYSGSGPSSNVSATFFHLFFPVFYFCLAESRQDLIFTQTGRSKETGCQDQNPQHNCCCFLSGHLIYDPHNIYFL